MGRHRSPGSPRGSRQSAPQWLRRRVPATPSCPARTAAPSASTGPRSPVIPGPGSAPRPPPRRPLRPSSDLSPHRVSRRMSATTRSAPAASRSVPAGSVRCQPTLFRRRSRRAAKTRLEQRIPAPVRRWQRRMPARRPAVGAPFRPTAILVPSRRTPCRLRWSLRGVPPPRGRIDPRPARVTRSPLGADRQRLTCRTWSDGPGDG
ncbi:Uncharacterised protein [Mycobacterium tuberculosis]|nr:Uncharacterised protein [Mycobacterium tuberculosis]